MQKCILSSGKLNEELLDLCINSLSFTQTVNGTKIATSGLTLEEIKNAVSTKSLAASQAATTGTTLGLGTAFKGLWIQIKSATTSLWAFLTTNPLGWFTMFVTAIGGVALALKKYDDYLEEAKQKIRDAAEESKSAIDAIKSNFDQLSSSTNNVKQRYAELAQEVENLGRINQSKGNLSTEDYKEFLDLSNQLAKLFPQLTIGYDNNGNAILNLSGNIDNIVGSLNDLVKAQQKLANEEIIKQMPNVWSGYILDLQDLNKDLEASEKKVESHLKWADGLRNRSQITIDSEEYNNLLVEAAKAANIMDSRYGNAFYKERNIATDAGPSFISATWDFSDLSDEEYEKLLNKILEFGSSYEDSIQLVKGQIGSANANLFSYINSWLSTEWNFNKLDFNLQSAIKSLLFSGNWIDIIPNNIDSGNWDAVSGWLQENILYEISKLQNDTELSKALSEVFVNTELSPNEKVNYLKQLQDFLGKDNVITILLQPQFEDAETLQRQYQDAVNFAQENFDGYDPTAFFKEHSINTQEEIDAWQKIAQGAKDAAEAEEKYIQSSTSNFESPLFTAFENTEFGTRIQHITDLFNQGTLSHKEYFSALQAEITNFDASNFTDSMEDMTKASSQFFVDSVQQTASGLSSLIDSFHNGEISISEYLDGYLAIGDTLSTLTDSLQENSAAWNEHGQAISEVGNVALDDTQNKLSSAMSVIESYQDSIYALEEIMNHAVTVGSDEFTAHANVIAQDLYHIALNGGEMADVIVRTLGSTTSEIAQSLTESVSNQEIACQAIMANTNVAIEDMSSSIGELFDALGDAISNFKVDLSFGVKSVDWKKVDVLGVELSLPEIKFELGASGESLDQIGNALSAFGKTVASNYTPQTIELEDFHFGSTDAAKERKYSPGAGITDNYKNALDDLKSTSQSAAKEAETDWKSLLDKETALLEKQLEAGVITFREYTDKRRAIIDQYYEDGKIKAADYYAALEDMYKYQLSSYDRVIKAVTKRIDDQVKQLEKQKESVEDSYQVKIDSIQEEIDALNKANEARKSQIELEKAQYEAERARDQRTKKVDTHASFRSNAV